MPDLDAVFDRLKAVLESHAESLMIVTDMPGNYYVNTTKSEKDGKPVFFGMVKTGKGKVAFHLMPVYCHPGLLDDVSETLRGRMQGKSCFHFVKEDESLFGELGMLVELGLKAYQAEGKA